MRNPSGACLFIAIVLTGIVEAAAAVFLGIHSIPSALLPVASLISLCVSGVIVLAGINAAVKSLPKLEAAVQLTQTVFPGMEAIHSAERSARRRGRDRVEMTNVRRRTVRVARTSQRMTGSSPMDLGKGRNGVSRSQGE
jgi:hypothetical protein